MEEVAKEAAAATGNVNANRRSKCILGEGNGRSSWICTEIEVKSKLLHSILLHQWLGGAKPSVVRSWELKGRSSFLNALRGRRKEGRKASFSDSAPKIRQDGNDANA